MWFLSICFEISPEQEDAAIVYWEKAADVMRKAPGFISTKLHRALLPETKFKLINVAQWESVEDFQNAVQSDAFQAATTVEANLFPHFPALYEVIRT